MALFFLIALWKSNDQVVLRTAKWTENKRKSKDPRFAPWLEQHLPHACYLKKIQPLAPRVPEALFVVPGAKQKSTVAAVVTSNPGRLMFTIIIVILLFSLFNFHHCRSAMSVKPNFDLCTQCQVLVLPFELKSSTLGPEHGADPSKLSSFCQIASKE